MKTHFLGAACACALLLAVSMSANAASVSGQGTWETTLQGRDLDGNLSTFEAYYDTALNITWLANANAGVGSAFDDGANTADGQMTWANANAWAAALDVNGITGWRLPTTVDVGNNGCSYTNFYQGVDCGYNITTHSEMSHMFYVTLGDKAYYDTSGVGPPAGSGLTNTGLFSNVQSGGYWSGTEYAPLTSSAWDFHFNGGGQLAPNKNDNYYAWAVRPGDVSAVPVPAAVWLFGSGLLGLLGVARRKAA